MFTSSNFDIDIDEKSLEQVLTSPEGPLGTSIVRGMRKASSLAVANITNAGLVDSGKMRGSVGFRLETDGTNLRGQVGVGVPYARYVHDGTPDRIYPRTAKALRFKPKGKRAFVFAKSVRGVRPTPFLANARDALTLRDFGL